MFEFILTLFVLVVCGYLWSRHRRASDTSNKRLPLPPGPTGLPIFGSIFSLPGGDPLLAFAEYRKRYGDIFSVPLGSRYTVVLCGADMVKEAFLKKGEAFAGRGSLMTLNTLFGSSNRGVLNSEGEYHRQHRKFVLQALKEFGMGRSIMEERIRTEATYLNAALSETNGKPFDPEVYLMSAVSNIVCQITFSKRFNYDNSDFVEFQGHIRRAFQALGAVGLINILPWTKYFPGVYSKYKSVVDARENIVNRFFKPQIEEHRRTYDANHLRDIIDAYFLELDKHSSSTFTEADVTYILGDLIFAGTDVVSSTLRWCLLYLLHYPHCQRRIHAEIDANIGKRAPTMADKKLLRYTDAFIKESLRHSGFVTVVLPHSNPEEAELAGYRIPAKSWIIAYLTVAKDEKSFKEPEKFKPERFLEGSDNVDAFIPFSTGARMCVAEGLAKMELFLILTVIMQTFSVELADADGPPPSKEGKYGIAMVPHPYKLRMVPR